MENTLRLVRLGKLVVLADGGCQRRTLHIKQESSASKPRWALIFQVVSNNLAWSFKEAINGKREGDMPMELKWVGTC